MNILVTGANGFVGSALGEYLEAKGDTVQRAIRREIVATAKPSGQVVGNIDASTDWTGALQDIDAVVHLAARVHVMNDHASDPLNEFRKVNTEGTINLARQAADAGVRRFVYLSTIKVNGENTGTGDRKNGIGFCEADTPAPSDDYAVSKWEAEQLLFQIAQETGMETVIIRPPLVYGPGVKANFYKMMHWLSKGIPLPLGAIHNKRSLVALENLVDLIATCIKHPVAANQVFLAGDGEDLSTTELLKRLGTVLGKPAHLVPVPQWLLEFALKMLGKGDMAQRLCGSLQVDISKARELLGWNPPVTVHEGLKRTVEWYLLQK